MFKSLPLTIRKIEATEARLNRIYDAAKLGLKGDTLALAAGMRPEEFRQLCELDPLAMMAVRPRRRRQGGAGNPQAPTRLGCQAAGPGRRQPADQHPGCTARSRRASASSHRRASQRGS